MAQLPEEVKQVIFKYAAKYPIPVSNEEASQNWTHKLAQQLKFSFPAAGWGHKSAGAGRPHSKDVVCLSSPFVGWDVILGAGTANPTLQLDGDSIDLTGQLFEEVEAKDFLGSVVEPPVEPPIPPPTGNTDALLMQILAELKLQTELMEGVAVGLSQVPAMLNAALDKGVKIRF